MLENVVKHNALNKTGLINYNKGGVKDGVGFQPCSGSGKFLWIISSCVHWWPTISSTRKVMSK